MALTYEILWESKWDADLTSVTVARVVVVYNVNLPTTGEVEANKIWSEDAASGLPIRGSVLNIFPFGSLVLDRIAHVETINAFEVKCLLVYRRSLTGYSGGPRRISRVNTGVNDKFTIPVIQQQTIGGTTTVFFEQYNRPYQRAQDQRIEVRFISGVTVSDFQGAVAENRGKLFVIDSQAYMLIGANASFDGLGYIRAEYVFAGSGIVRSFATNSVLKNAVAIPALLQWEEYAIDWSQQTASNIPPTITPIPALDLYQLGGTPPLPGMP